MSTATLQELERPVSTGQTSYVMSKKNSTLRQRARETVSREPGFIANPNFNCLAEAQIDGEEEFVQIIERGGSIRAEADQVSGLPAHLARLCETPLLSPGQERSLFRRMNLLKFKANVHRCGLNIDSPDVEDLDEIDDLLLRAGYVRDHIVQANLRLVMSIAKGFASSMVVFDELLSEGISAMMKAVDKFDYDRGFRFSTYTTCAVRRELCRMLERQQKQRQRFSTNATDYLDASQCVDSPPEVRGSDVGTLRRTLFQMVERLDDREQFVIRNRFALNIDERKKTFVELGENLGVSKQRVRQLTERAIDKLRAMAAEFGIETLDLEG